MLALSRHLAVGTWLDLGRHEMDLLHERGRCSTRAAWRSGGASCYGCRWPRCCCSRCRPDLAYWLVYPHAGDGRPALRFDSLATRACRAGWRCRAGAGHAWLHNLGPGLVVSCLLLAIAVLTLLGVAYCFVLCRSQPADRAGLPRACTHAC
ncbi:hypothetical protein ACU4GD_30095 [Cupriavidus basilensis]